MSNIIIDDGLKKAITNFLKKDCEEQIQEFKDDELKKSFYLDYESLDDFNEEITKDLRNNPKMVIHHFKKAIEDYDEIEVKNPRVLIENYNEHNPRISELRDTHLSKLVAIDGVVSKTTAIEPKAEVAAFECKRCQTITNVKQPLDAKLRYPTICSNEECNNATENAFRIIVSQSETINFRKVEIQEPPEETKGGETPESKTFTAKGEVAKNIKAGDNVKAIGIYRGTEQSGDTSVFRTYIEGNNIIPEEQEFEEIDITPEEEEKIIELSQKPDIYERLRDSVAPQLFGLENEKEATMYQLFSGVRKTLEGTKIRGDIHLLLIGDPGTGKTISGNTIIETEKGEIKIQKFVEDILPENPEKDNQGDYIEKVNDDVKVYGLDKDGEKELRNVEAVWKKKAPENVYIVKLENGLELTATATHPLFIPDGEAHIKHKKIEDIIEDENQYIAVSKHSDNTSNKTDIIPNISNVIDETVTLEQKYLNEKDKNYLEKHIKNNSKQNYKRINLKELINKLYTLLKKIELNEKIDETKQYKQDIHRVHENLIRLESLAWGDIKWVKIDEIVKQQPDFDWMYDLQIEETHNYITNGIISHNSQLLRYVSKLSPRGVMTNGKGASEAGLTAAAVKDSEFGGDENWTIKAGALVLADQGVACVDELDKMDASDRSAMHEGLEQQRISISKAGINATLKSRCTLLGAANPKDGRWNEYDPISDQIDLDPPLISRFDLIFAPQDKIEEEKDGKLAEHILNTNLRGQQLEVGMTPSNKTQDVEPEISPELFRKYVVYAKKNSKPVMTDEAYKKIRDFFVEIRQEGKEEGAIPVTARKIEGIIRVSEAVAKIQLAEEITEEHADRAINLIIKSLKEVGYDEETGRFDVDKVETNTTMSQRERIKLILQVIDDNEDKGDKGAPKDTIIKILKAKGFEEEQIKKDINLLKRDGKEIYSPKKNEFLRM